MLARQLAATLLFLLVSLPSWTQEQPVVVSVCQLLKSPRSFDKKRVVVHGSVSLAFEDFTLRSPDCPEEIGIWLLYGGDAETPTIYCCGNHERTPGVNIRVEGITIPLVRDAVLNDFHRRLTANRHYSADGASCHDCYFYKLSATLVGRFFAGYPDSESLMPGYGHLGCCRLLAIEQVQRFEAKRTEVPPHGDFACDDKRWAWKESRREGRAVQKAAKEQGQAWRASDANRVAEEFLDQKMKDWGETKSGTTRMESAEVFGDNWIQEAYWVSSDGLTSYWLRLRKPSWLKRAAGGLEQVVWLPYGIERHHCYLIPRSETAVSPR